MLRTTLAEAFEPQRIEALIHLIQEDLGYHLHRSVQKVKCDLSAAMGAEFHFSDGGIEIHATVMRKEFEEWIGEELAKIESCVDDLLALGRGGARGCRYGIPHGRHIVRTGGEADLRIALRRSGFGPGTNYVGGAGAGGEGGGSAGKGLGSMRDPHLDVSLQCLEQSISTQRPQRKTQRRPGIGEYRKPLCFAVVVFSASSSAISAPLVEATSSVERLSTGPGRLFQSDESARKVRLPRSQLLENRVSFNQISGAQEASGEFGGDAAQ